MPPRQRPEALLERQVLAELGRDPRLVVFKNECGEGYTSNVRALIREALAGYSASPAVVQHISRILDTHRIHYGLHNGSADLCGVLEGGRFLSLELKSERGQLRPEQAVWQARMRELGAVAEVVRSPGDAVRFVEDARRGQR